MKLAIEDAIYEAAPDILSLEVEGVAEEPVRAHRSDLFRWNN